MSFAYHSTLQINEPNSSLSSKDKKHNTAFVILVKKKINLFWGFRAIRTCFDQSTNREVVQFQNYCAFLIFKKKNPHKIMYSE